MGKTWEEDREDVAKDGKENENQVLILFALWICEGAWACVCVCVCVRGICFFIHDGSRIKSEARNRKTKKKKMKKKNNKKKKYDF